LAQNEQAAEDQEKHQKGQQPEFLPRTHELKKLGKNRHWFLILKTAFSASPAPDPAVLAIQ